MKDNIQLKWGEETRFARKYLDYNNGHLTLEIQNKIDAALFGIPTLVVVHRPTSDIPYDHLRVYVYFRSSEKNKEVEQKVLNVLGQDMSPYVSIVRRPMLMIDDDFFKLEQNTQFIEYKNMDNTPGSTRSPGEKKFLSQNHMKYKVNFMLSRKVAWVRYCYTENANKKIPQRHIVIRVISYERRSDKELELELINIFGPEAKGFFEFKR